MTDLGVLSGGTYSYALGINSSGTIVGQADSGGPTNHAFIVIGGILVDLNTLLDASGTGWTLQQAFAINDSGQIIGFGYNSLGQGVAFLLTPAPEPSTWLSVTGALLFAATLRRRRSS